MSRPVGDGPLRVGETRSGLSVRLVTPLPAMDAVAYELEHPATGAQVLHIHAPRDPENLQAIVFATPPTDDCGLPHILEHAVLAGSRRYRVKDPFFEMRKMSMATFLNAMTGSDATYYPVASNVRQDFDNLREVYWDAVFHPLLAEQTFRREGHRLELSEPSKADSGLLIKGIVYNEMKGYFSSPTAQLGRLSFRGLFPDTAYARESGGDPEAIPRLTYEQFRAFHERFYHPGNARIFIYGDIATADHAQWLGERLAGFEPRPPAERIQLQRAWAEPRLREERYAVAPSDPVDRRTFLTMNWLIGDGTDAAECMAFEVLDYILLGNEAAPLRRAIIDSRLGEDLVQSGFRTFSRQSHFHIGLQGAEENGRGAFETLVLETLRRLSVEPIAPERVEAAFQQLAFEHLEIGSQYPMQVMYRVLAMWQYDADPLTLLRAGELVDELKRRWRQDPVLFGRLIRDRLLENTHRLSLTLAPDPTLQGQKDAAFAQQMGQARAALSPQDLERIAAQARELEQAQNTPNRPEDVAALPQLSVSDLPRRPRHIPTTAQPIADGLVLLRNDVPANGVNYLHLSIDLSGLEPGLWEWLGLYGECVRKLGAAGCDYIRMAERLAAHTGGVGFSTSVDSRVDDSARGIRTGTFTLKFVNDQADAALSVLGDLVLGLDVRDQARMRDVLAQGRAAQRNAFINNGMGIGLLHAARTLNAESALAEVMGGLPQMRLIKRLADGFEGCKEEVFARLESVRGFLTGGRALTASFTGSPSVHDRVVRTLETWRERMPLASPAAQADGAWPAATPLREGLAGPMQVAYCTMVCPAPHLSHADAPLLSVAANLLLSEYVLPEVRFKGTAYGGGCVYNSLRRLWQFYSYRDPWITRTLGVYENAPAWLVGANWSQLDVDRAIIGTSRDAEKPIRPGAATGTALWRHLIGDSVEFREARHARLLSAKAGEVRRALVEQFGHNLSRAGVCVVSSREKLESANRDDPSRPLAIEDVSV